jgi:hypothetical protein
MSAAVAHWRVGPQRGWIRIGIFSIGVSLTTRYRIHPLLGPTLPGEGNDGILIGLWHDKYSWRGYLI